MMIILQMESETLVTHLLIAMGDLLALVMGRSIEKNTLLDIDRGERSNGKREGRLLVPDATTTMLDPGERLLESDEILEEESSGFK